VATVWVSLDWIALGWLQQKQLRHLVARSHIVQDREEQNLLQVLCYCGLLVKNSDMWVLKLWIHWDLRYMCTHIINEWWYPPFEDLLINVLKKLAATWSRRSHCFMQSSSLSDLQAYTSICSLWSIYITYTYTHSHSLSRQGKEI
jgi:hypothetical protein